MPRRQRNHYPSTHEHGGGEWTTRRRSWVGAEPHSHPAHRTACALRMRRRASGAPSFHVPASPGHKGVSRSSAQWAQAACAVGGGRWTMDGLHCLRGLGHVSAGSAPRQYGARGNARLTGVIRAAGAFHVKRATPLSRVRFGTGTPRHRLPANLQGVMRVLRNGAQSMGVLSGRTSTPQASAQQGAPSRRAGERAAVIRRDLSETAEANSPPRCSHGHGSQLVASPVAKRPVVARVRAAPLARGGRGGGAGARRSNRKAMSRTP